MEGAFHSQRSSLLYEEVPILEAATEDNDDAKMLSSSMGTSTSVSGKIRGGENAAQDKMESHELVLRDWILCYDRRTGLFYHFNTRTGQSEWALEEEEDEEEGEDRGGEETALCGKKEGDRGKDGKEGGDKSRMSWMKETLCCKRLCLALLYRLEDPHHDAESLRVTRQGGGRNFKGMSPSWTAGALHGWCLLEWWRCLWETRWPVE
ncbi:hypothetical protein NSK_008311 [Nannochloropsis salina CCMP1776]|uniref:WW domain-containing protein n=1 Tax=Nannochloropsis salina CCMP1776 TaxID=1027361 RepID=A0A4D9CS01_9STRA|nr:hypothetical protein NSK_008311 [Nannochloropsis salina CCMP1776]|eukprot:TFJ80345.1 hypothetical protein NSK_008311 [Nannochloropsis salina CCMP1776]